MKFFPYVVIDAANSMTLGEGKTEREAIEAAAKWLDAPKRVTIHGMKRNGYTKRTVVMSSEGIIGGKPAEDDDEDHPMGQSG